MRRLSPPALSRLFVLALVLAGPAPLRAQCPSEAESAVADRIVDVFDKHRFVFFGSTHGGVKRQELLRCVLDRAAPRASITDVVVEFLSGAHQGLLDRYLIGLESIPPDSIRALAMDTDNPRLFATLPQVPEFLRAVRALNEALPLSERVRIWGASEPIEWASVRVEADLAPYPFKTNYTAHLITRHLFPDPDRRTLVVFGDGHIHHEGGTLMADLEAELSRDSMFVIGTLTGLEEGEHALIAALGDPEGPFFVTSDEFPDLERLPARLRPMVEAPATGRVTGEALARRMEAIVYLGPTPDRNLQGTIPFSEEETAELGRRARIDGRSAMEIRFGGRDRWFSGHPNDVPEDPRGG